MHVLEDPSHDEKIYDVLADHSFIMLNMRPIYDEWPSEPPILPPHRTLTTFGSEDACFAIAEVTHFYDSDASNFEKLARAWSYYKYGIIWLQRYQKSAKYAIELVLAARTLLEANRKRLLKIDESWEPEIARKFGFKKLLPVYNLETGLHEMPKNVDKKTEKRLARMVKAVEGENQQRMTFAFEARKPRLILGAIEKLFRAMHLNAEKTLDKIVRMAKLQALRHENMREQYRFRASIVGGAQLVRLTAFETTVPHETIMQIFDEALQIVGWYERQVDGVLDDEDKEDCVRHLTYFNGCACNSVSGGRPCAECETVRKAARLFGCGVCRELWKVNA